MKLMDTERMIVCACEDDRLLSSADNRLLPVVREAGLSEDFLSAGLKAGKYCAREVRLDGRPLYVLYFSTGAGTCYFVAGAAVSDEQRPDLLFDAFEIIAGENGCKRIVINTKRGGFVRLAVRRNYAARGVALEKVL
jgi:hypothetical protein